MEVEVLLLLTCYLIIYGLQRYEYFFDLDIL